MAYVGFFYNVEKYELPGTGAADIDMIGKQA